MDYLTLLKREHPMGKESGDKKSPIWLLGDSNHEGWEYYLETPFDRRHPAIHNIWTPVIDIIQVCLGCA